MKTSPRLLVLAALALGLLAPGLRAALTTGMTEGKPAFQSMTQLAFGPEGILFIADPKAAAIVAVATDDTKAAPDGATIKIEGINQKIAALLGTEPAQIKINDLAVNPVSRQAYLTVSRGTGPDAVPVLLRVATDGKLSAVALDKVKFSRAELPDAPIDGLVGTGRQQKNNRLQSVTDMAYNDGRVIIAGLANEEFSSTLRAIPFPFAKAAVAGTTVEIFHTSHNQFETRAPVLTFVAYSVAKEQKLLTAYLCTPLVEFALKDLKPGEKIRGKTIAEFGNGNLPLDMIVYQKEGKDYLLLTNSARGVMKVAAEQVEKAAALTQQVPGTGGLAFTKVDWTGVDQMDRLDSRSALVVRRPGADASVLNLETLALP